jgi:type IV secretory pathway VirB2 component (pilin)
MSQGKESHITPGRCEPSPPRLIRFWLSCARWQRFSLFALAATALCLCEPSYSQSFGKINTALQTLVDFMTGTTGRLLGILGVAGLGVAAWFGRLSYWRAGEIILGIAIVFGAAEIVDLFAR